MIAALSTPCQLTYVLCINPVRGFMVDLFLKCELTRFHYVLAPETQAAQHRGNREPTGKDAREPCGHDITVTWRLLERTVSRVGVRYHTA